MEIIIATIIICWITDCNFKIPTSFWVPALLIILAANTADIEGKITALIIGGYWVLWKIGRYLIELGHKEETD